MTCRIAVVGIAALAFGGCAAIDNPAGTTYRVRVTRMLKARFGDEEAGSALFTP